DRSLNGDRSRSRSRSRSYKSQSRSRSKSRTRYASDSRSRSRSRSRSGSTRRRRSSRHSRSRSRSHRGRERSRSPMSSRRRHLGNRDRPQTSNCVGVFGLSLTTQERDLKDVFSKYGDIENLQIVYDHKTGRSRGFAFIYYRKEEDAIEAKERAPGMDIDGRPIRVDYSITERAHTPTPGVYLGKSSRPSRRDERDRDYDRYERRDRGYSSRSSYYDRGYDRDRDRGYYSRRRSPSPYYRRRSPSPYYRRRSPSPYHRRSRSRSWSPRRYR
ncbi:unnamed protein product, partial [Owenia fusiformis]